jgi:hypothetical protein
MENTVPPEVEGEDEWSTVGAASKPRRLAPQSTIIRPDFAVPSSTAPKEAVVPVEKEVVVKKIVKYTRDELVSLRPAASESLDCMKDLTDIVCKDTLEPEVCTFGSPADCAL